MFSFLALSVRIDEMIMESFMKTKLETDRLIMVEDQSKTCVE